MLHCKMIIIIAPVWNASLDADAPAQDRGHSAHACIRVNAHAILCYVMSLLVVYDVVMMMMIISIYYYLHYYYYHNSY